jgi:hypothetical protein
VFKTLRYIADCWYLLCLFHLKNERFRARAFMSASAHVLSCKITDYMRSTTFLTCLQEEICQLKALLKSSHQQQFSRPAPPALLLCSDRPAVEISLDQDPESADSRLQRHSTAVALQPCLANSKNRNWILGADLVLFISYAPYQFAFQIWMRKPEYLSGFRMTINSRILF